MLKEYDGDDDDNAYTTIACIKLAR